MSATTAIAICSLVVSIGTGILPFVYRRLFQSPLLRIHKSGFIQLHFGSYGPGIGLVCAIQAVHRPHFVTSVDILVVHEQTKEEHTLVWRVLFPDAFTSIPSSQATKDIPTGKMVNPQEEYRFNAFFADPEVEFETVREIADRVQREWLGMVAKVLVEVHTQSPEAMAQLIAQSDQTRRTLFAEFMQSDTFRWALEKLNSHLYWRQGFYSMTIRAHSAETKKVFSSAWRFEVTEDCVRKLRANTEMAIADIAGIPNLLWAACTLDYLEPL